MLARGAALHESHPEVFTDLKPLHRWTEHNVCRQLEKLAELGVVAIVTHYQADPALTESYDLFTMYTMQEQLTENSGGGFMEKWAKKLLRFQNDSDGKRR